MTLKFGDLVYETTLTGGLGTVTLRGTAAGYQTFGAGIGTGQICYYVIRHVTLNEWEVGIGTVTVGGGVTTVSRDTVLASSNAGAKVNFSAGTKEVRNTFPAAACTGIFNGSANAYTLTTANFTMPAVSATVSVAVASTAWMAVGQEVFVSDGTDTGYMVVASITDDTHVVLRNDGTTGNATTGTTINTPAAVSPGGKQGPAGANGTNGTNGSNGTNGTNGSVWRDGSGAPANSLGVNGDYYLDDATGNVYLKTGGAYSVVANIKGASGTNGAGVPTGGAAGDLLAKHSGTNYDTRWSAVTVDPATDKFGFLASFGAFDTATDGPTITFDFDQSDQWQVTLGGNRTLAFSHASVGQRVLILLYQDATGGRTVTWWSNIAWNHGYAPVLDRAANGWDLFVLECVGLDTYSVPKWKEVSRTSSAPWVLIGPGGNNFNRGLPLSIEHNVPGILFYELDGGTDEKAWDFWANFGSLYFRAVSDDLLSYATWLQVDRSGTTVSAVKFQSPTRVDAVFRHKQSWTPVTAAVDGATIAFDLGESDLHHVTLGGNRTLALSNSVFGQSFKVTIQQDGTGSRTVTWWSNILWPGGVVPTLTTTPNKRDVFEFICYAAGNYYGKVWAQNL